MRCSGFGDTYTDSVIEVLTDAPAIKLISIRAVSGTMGQTAHGVIWTIFSTAVTAVVSLVVLAAVYNWGMRTMDPGSAWVSVTDSIAATGAEVIVLIGGGTLIAVFFLVQTFGESFGGR